MSTDRPATGDDGVRPAEASPPPEPGAQAEPQRLRPPEAEATEPIVEPTRLLPSAAAQPPDRAWPPPEGPRPFPPAGPAQPLPGATFHQPRHLAPGPSGSGSGQWSPTGQSWPPPGGSAGWGGYPSPPNHWSTSPPPPLSGQQPSTARAARPRDWLVALVVVTGVTLVGLITTVAVPWLNVTSGPNRPIPGSTPPAPTSTPTTTTTPAGTPSPSPTPSTPTPTMPTDPEELLKQNPIYGLKVPAKCPDQRIPSSQSAYRKQVQALVNCLNTAWKKALAKTPVEFSKPKVKFYSSSAKSPCGKLGTNFPASYCSANHTLYFSRAAYEQGRYFRLSVAHFVIHEYAHHVQELAGLLGPATMVIKNKSELSRRIELQAHCMAHYGLTHSGLDFGSYDRRDAEHQFGYTNDAKGHGSTKAERYWGERGLEAKNIGACNTWKVKASRVK